MQLGSSAFPLSSGPCGAYNNTVRNINIVAADSDVAPTVWRAGCLAASMSCVRLRDCPELELAHIATTAIDLF